VFLGDRSRQGKNHLSPNWFYRCIFTPMLLEVRIDDFVWHDLGHHYASSLAMAAVDVPTIQELLGQHSLEMALRYSHLSPAHKRAAVEKIVPSRPRIDPK
jgi:site-specific recombinase XerD